jgi:predicted transcriptional regulator
MELHSKLFAIRLSQSEAEFLARLARANDRSRSAELRRLLREKMTAAGRQSAIPLFGRMP